MRCRLHHLPPRGGSGTRWRGLVEALRHWLRDSLPLGGTWGAGRGPLVEKLRRRLLDLVA